ncbi:MAG: hypothetical protein AAFX87_23780 [Bacteroidota bacterium]
MALFYRNLFAINILHDFYNDGYSQDFATWPTKETAEVIQGERMILKATRRGFRLAYRAIDTSGTPLIDLDDNTFKFVLSLQNIAEFMNFTILDDGPNEYAADKILYFKNDPEATQALTHELLDGLRPIAFAFEVPFLAADPATHEATIEVTDDNDNNVLGPVNIKPDRNGRYEYAVDLKNTPKGIYRIKYSDDTHPQATQRLYIDSDLYRKDVFGIVEINTTNTSLDQYDVTFLRKATHWKYYVVNKTGNVDLASVDLSIQDTSGDTGNPYNVYTFNKGAEPDPTVRINGFDTVIFTSVDTIPFFEVPKLSLELRKTPDANPIIIKNLENPQLTGITNDSNESEIYVFV